MYSQKRKDWILTTTSRRYLKQSFWYTSHDKVYSWYVCFPLSMMYNSFLIIRMILDMSVYKPQWLLYQNVPTHLKIRMILVGE